MIRRITSILNESVTAIPVGERVPFAEVIDGVPSVHAGGGQFVPVINDNAGGVSYWRPTVRSRCSRWTSSRPAVTRFAYRSRLLLWPSSGVSSVMHPMPC